MRKPRIPKAGPLPPMTRLKQLSEDHQALIVEWLKEKPQTEVAALITRNFDIEPGSPESWPSLLSEWLGWYWRKLDRQEASTISEELAEFMAEINGEDPSPETLRDYQLKMVTRWLSKTRHEDPKVMLAMARELRAGETLQLAKDKWIEARQKKLDAGLDALHEELKGNARAMEIFRELQEALSGK